MKSQTISLTGLNMSLYLCMVWLRLREPIQVITLMDSLPFDKMLDIGPANYNHDVIEYVAITTLKTEKYFDSNSLTM